jgi:hypothetical protein
MEFDQEKIEEEEGNLVFLLIGFAFGPVKTATLVGFLIVQARSWFDSGWVCMVVQSVARLAAPVNGLNNDYIYIY